MAEGVEDSGTLELLRSMGCVAAQGYHMSIPLSADVFTRFVEQHQHRIPQLPA